MKKIIHVVELEDGFIGNLKEIAEHLGVSYRVVSNNVLLKKEKIAKKYNYKDLGKHYLHTIYRVTNKDGFIFDGDKKEISKKLYYSIGYIEKNICKGKIGDYYIKKIKEVYRKEPMRLWTV